MRKNMAVTISVDEDPAAATDPTQHHHIGVAQNQHLDIGAFIRTHSEDPAIKVKRLMFVLSESDAC
jgi:hypothetical protein